MLTMSSCVSKNNNVPYRIIEGEAIMVDVDKGEVMHLNEVGSEIWNSIDGKRTVEDIIRHICAAFEVDEVAAGKDVIEFIHKLGGKGVVSY